MAFGRLPRRATILLAGALLGAAAGRATAQATTSAARPRLVVLISVDQLRGDLLPLYDTLFTGGFHRLLHDGAYFTAATHDHADTETGPGHAVLGTGTYPSKNGMVANAWYEQGAGGWTREYVVGDVGAPILGDPGAEGRSPRNLLHDGLADWIRRAYPDAKLLSVAGKDRAAVLLMGRARGQVYWFDPAVGRFVTSRYYMDAYPEWVVDFERDSLPALLADSVWKSTIPAAGRRLAQPDSSRWEGDGTHTFFPHWFRNEAHGRSRQDFYDWLEGTPFPDEATLRMAEAGIRALGMGQDSVPDYLAIGLSQTDYIGHAYGPLSQEQLDNLLRLDRELGTFFDMLDRTVGRGRWVVALSADHGVLTQPEILQKQGIPARRLPTSMLQRAARAASNAAANGPPAAAARRAADALKKFDFVANAMTVDQMLHGEADDSFATFYRRAYYPGRMSDGFAGLGVVWQPRMYTLFSDSPTGTTHGTPYWYDRWVPIAFLGDDIPATVIDRRVAAVDVAPTLARLAGVPLPSDLDGHPLRLQATAGVAGSPGLRRADTPPASPPGPRG
jgi:Type I phosphodiesterase / nucleotide pyrophosphatase